MCAILLGGGASTAAASSSWAWVGPYSTYATCEESAQGYRDAGGVASGCSYRDLVHTVNDGYYFRALPIP